MTSSQTAAAITTVALSSPHRADTVWALVWESADYHLASKRIADDLCLALGGCSGQVTADAAQSRIAEMGEQELRP
jgi:hypothetical protein